MYNLTWFGWICTIFIILFTVSLLSDVKVELIKLNETMSKIEHIIMEERDDV